jgi:hypothetical protein
MLRLTLKEAVARYYHEKLPNFEGRYRGPMYPSKTYKFFQQESWQDQRHIADRSASYDRNIKPGGVAFSTGE